MPTTTAPQKRRAMTVNGDARGSVGQLRGPDARGQLLIIDAADYDGQRTRLSLRPPTDEEVRAAVDRPSDDMGTQPFDLPLTVAGPVGYVDVACASCGVTTRQHGITSESKAWGLCPDCLTLPGARALVETKRRELREAAAAEDAAQVEARRPTPGAITGPVVIRIIALASEEFPTPLDGQWLVEYDPTRPGVDPGGRPMTAHILTSPDRSAAATFPTIDAAFEEWRRESGLPYPRNAPLTAYSIEVVPVGAPDDAAPDVIVPWGGAR